MYVLGPCGSLQQLSSEAGTVPCCLNPHRFFQLKVLRLYPPAPQEPWVLLSVSLPSCSSRFISTRMWDCALHQPLSGPSASHRPPWSSSHHLASSPLRPGVLYLPLLPVWMNISSVTPWLLDFHTVQFSGSSGCFLFLSLLLSFFWLCAEALCIYLHLHLGRKFLHYPIISCADLTMGLSELTPVLQCTFHAVAKLIFHNADNHITPL